MKNSTRITLHANHPPLGGGLAGWLLLLRYPKRPSSIFIFILPSSYSLKAVKSIFLIKIKIAWKSSPPSSPAHSLVSPIKWNKCFSWRPRRHFLSTSLFVKISRALIHSTTTTGDRSRSKRRGGLKVCRSALPRNFSLTKAEINCHSCCFDGVIVVPHE